MSSGLRLLLVDDDRALASVLVAALSEEGFEVSVAHDGREGLRRFDEVAPDVVILDVLMPELDGLEVCRRIRAKSRVPILLLTSRAEEVDKVMGLDLGADDYVTKPFSTRELCARIRALGRRAQAASGAAHGAAESALQAAGAAPSPRPSPGGRAERSPNELADSGAPTLSRGPLSVDRARFEVTWRGSVVPLTRSEFLVVSALAEKPGVVLSRERLIDVARGEDVVVTDRTVDSYVKRIRKKFRDVEPEFDALETAIGVGYRWKER